VDSSSLEESESDAPRGFFRRRSATVYASAAAGRADDARRGRGEAAEVAGGWDQLGGGDGADEERRRDPGGVPRWAVEEQRKREVSMRPGGKTGQIWSIRRAQRPHGSAWRLGRGRR